MTNLFKRIYQISNYSKQANDPIAAINMAVLGFARGHTFSGSDLLSRAGRFFFPQLAIRPKVFNGLTAILNPADISHLVIADEFIVDNVYDLTKLEFIPDLIIDCGAHIGLFTLLAASHFPSVKITCFEPNPENVEWLSTQVKINHLRVNIVAAAVAVEDGVASFAAECGCGGSLINGSQTGDSAISVNTVCLTDYILNEKCKRLLIKMDVEGEELTLLPEIIEHLPSTCALFFETHHGETACSDMAALLSSHKFKVITSRMRGQYADSVAIRNL
jgi:FkbM family methyltransferase